MSGQTHKRRKIMTRTTQKELESLVEWLNKITNKPTKPYMQNENGDYKAQIGNYHLSYAYGGVTLHQMVSDGGGVTTPLGGGYFTKRELAAKLRAFIAGIEVGKH
jgi:hypothetical protein